MIVAHESTSSAATSRRPRILFVDDDRMILSVLRRLLAIMCPQWDAEFVESGDRALGVLDSRQFDVLVTDLEMPRMSGISLIERVVLLHPQVARVVYSSTSDTLAKAPVREFTHAIVDKASGPQRLFEALHGLCAQTERSDFGALAHAS